MLAEFQALTLVVRADAFAVKRARTFEQAFENEARHHLAVFQNERNFVRAHFEHGARAIDIASPAVAEAGVEETRVVDAEFADRRIVTAPFRRRNARECERVRARPECKSPRDRE